MRIGDKVTTELKCWYDDEAKPNWPNPQYIGTIEKVRNIGGQFYAYVRYESGRYSHECLDNLTVVKTI